VIVVRLKEAIAAYERRSGRRMTYEDLSKATGLSRETLQSVATRGQYNTTLSTLDRLCAALVCTPGELLEYVPGEQATDQPLPYGQ
jgi:DNA-binding Xre family transcriptional regulator